MFNIDQFRESIVKSTLNDLVMHSAQAEELLIFTCANESLGGTYLRQINGPALGIYQMEPETYNDIWQTYLKNNPKLTMIMLSNFNVAYMPSPDRLVYDLKFATAMTRIFYRRISQPLPAFNDLDGIWNYYKNFYNTSKGAAQKDEAIQNYLKFVRG